MTRFLAVAILSLALVPAAYAKSAKTPTAQQEKMKTCNADATKQGLKGEARKKFMSECLSANGAPAAKEEKKLTPQQEKMKTCNASATSQNLKGQARKDFMSKCLKGQ